MIDDEPIIFIVTIICLSILCVSLFYFSSYENIEGKCLIESKCNQLSGNCTTTFKTGNETLITITSTAKSEFCFRGET